MNKWRLGGGALCLAFAALLAILNEVRPEGTVVFMVDGVNMPLVPIVGLTPDADPALSAAYVREMAHISQPQYLGTLQRTYRRTFRRYHAALTSEFFSAYLSAPWDALAERQQALSAMLRAGDWLRDAPPASDPIPSTVSPLSTIALPTLSTEEILARHPFLQLTQCDHAEEQALLLLCSQPPRHGGRWPSPCELRDHAGVNQIPHSSASRP